MKRVIAFFSLFGSMGTLVCCALPALFVSLGAGATFATVLGHVPQLIWLSEHKRVVFGFAGTLLIMGGIAQWRSRNEPCPIDIEQATACATARRVSFIVFSISVAIFLIGAGFAMLPDLIN